ncbi:hypothetical protein OGATHE_004999 [Ogataea polymorpha]|uniref:Uncharacterized protein n=1 Tax=Ogataea polymorpha TaxID=460523 RepID=A0A9P8NWD5_9ASCO|nr:hypothetical protein OGATHE_004999 [Ogataea polymorpha]
MESCAIYQNPSGFGFLIGSLLALGIYVSYIPQHLKIVNRRTSEGLSPLFLLLGSTSGFSSLVNLLLVSSPARKCCLTDLNKFQCIYSQLGLIQVAAQAIGYSLILILCAYLTRPPIDVPGSNEEKIGRALQQNNGFRKFQRNLVHSPRNGTIFAPDPYHLHAETRRNAFHAYDAAADPRRVPVELFAVHAARLNVEQLAALLYGRQLATRAPDHVSVLQGPRPRRNTVVGMTV